jgi:hypothetical protein
MKLTKEALVSPANVSDVPAVAPDTRSVNPVTIHEAIDMVGLGRFHLKLMFISGIL